MISLCPSRIPITKLKVVHSFAESLDKEDIVKVTQTTCSNAGGCLDKSNSPFETRVKCDKRAIDLREENRLYFFVFV